MQTEITKIEYKSVDEAIEAISKLEASDVSIVFNSTFKSNNGCNYYFIYFKINGKQSTFTVKFNRENLKITPQKITKDGPSKVRCSFFLKETKLGELFELIEKLVVAAVRVKLPEKSYPNLVGYTQYTTKKKNEEGIEEDVPIKKPLGWLVLPNVTQPYDKTTFSGSISILNTVDKNKTQKLTKPKFNTITTYWKSRAVANGSFKLDSVLLMKSKQIFLYAAINTYDSLVVLPIESNNVDDTENVDDLYNYATEKGIVHENKVFDEEDINNFEEPN